MKKILWLIPWAFLPNTLFAFGYIIFGFFGGLVLGLGGLAFIYRKFTRL